MHWRQSGDRSFDQLESLTGIETQFSRCGKSSRRSRASINLNPLQGLKLIELVARHVDPQASINLNPLQGLKHKTLHLRFQKRTASINLNPLQGLKRRELSQQTRNAQERFDQLESLTGIETMGLNDGGTNPSASINLNPLQGLKQGWMQKCWCR